MPQQYPLIVHFKEKHGSYYFIANADHELRDIYDRVLNSRIEDGNWYTKDDIEDIRNSRKFLLSRCDYEYEFVEEIIPERQKE